MIIFFFMKPLKVCSDHIKCPPPHMEFSKCNKVCLVQAAKALAKIFQKISLDEPYRTYTYGKRCLTFSTRYWRSRRPFEYNRLGEIYCEDDPHMGVVLIEFVLDGKVSTDPRKNKYVVSFTIRSATGEVEWVGVRRGHRRVMPKTENRVLEYLSRTAFTMSAHLTGDITIKGRGGLFMHSLWFWKVSKTVVEVVEASAKETCTSVLFRVNSLRMKKKTNKIVFQLLRRPGRCRVHGYGATCYESQVRLSTLA